MRFKLVLTVLCWAILVTASLLEKVYLSFVWTLAPATEFIMLSQERRSSYFLLAAIKAHRKEIS